MKRNAKGSDLCSLVVENYSELFYQLRECALCAARRLCHIVTYAVTVDPESEHSKGCDRDHPAASPPLAGAGFLIRSQPPTMLRVVAARVNQELIRVMTDDDERSQQEIARRRDETVKRMIKMPPKTQRGAPKRAPQSSSSKGKRGS